MNFISRIVVALAIVASTTKLDVKNGHAEIGRMDGNLLFEECSSDHATLEMSCLSFVMGVLEGYVNGAIRGYMTASMGPTKDKFDPNNPDPEVLAKITKTLELVMTGNTGPILGFCLPEDVLYIQIVDLVKKHLGNHPELRHFDVNQIVIEVTEKAFPCP